MRDIASALGLSVSTVSLALSDHPRIAAATKERVLKTAQQLGYKRSAVLSATLSTVRSGGRKTFREIIACVSLSQNVEEARREIERHPNLPQREGTQRYLANLAAGLAERAEEIGCSLDYFSLESQSVPALVRTLNARGIRRVILVSQSAQGVSPHIRPLLDQFFVVFLGLFNSSTIEGVALQVDYFQAGQRAIWEAWRAGYRNIFLHNTISYLSPGRRFEAGLSLATRHASRAPSFRVLNDNECQPNNWRRWIASAAPGSCLIGGVPRDELPWLRQWIKEHPGFGYIDWHANLERGGVAGLDQRDHDLARAAIDVCIGARIEATLPRVAERLVLIEPRWIDGETLPPIAESTPALYAERPFPAAAGASRHPLPLGECARPLGLPGSPWATHCFLQGLRTGSIQIHGVPFKIAADPGTGAPLLIGLSNRHGFERPEDGGVEKIALPIGQKARKLYFYHCCAYAQRQAPVAWYRLRFRRGPAVEVPVIPRYAGSANNDMHGDPPPEVNIQDWWHRSESLSTPSARPVIVMNPKGAEVGLTGRHYLLEWENPNPDNRIEELELVAAPGANALLAVFAITLETGPR